MVLSLALADDTRANSSSEHSKQSQFTICSRIAHSTVMMPRKERSSWIDLEYLKIGIKYKAEDM